MENQRCRRPRTTWLGRLGLRQRFGREKRRGQILLMYGIAATAVMGFAGLGVDGGHIFAQRRLVQNGADAAALVAARDIVKASFSRIDDDVRTYVQNNAESTTTATWSYVNNVGATVGQPNATGVTVLATKTFPTIFLRALGIPTFTVNARATARAQLLAGANEVPFIVCAEGLLRTDPPSGFPSGLVDYSTAPPTVREEAIYQAGAGPEFVIHGSHVGQSDPYGDCGWSASSSFKGNANDGNCSTLPCYYPFMNGTKSGPTNVRVAGLPGCQMPGGIDNPPEGCVAILPIAARNGSSGDTCARPVPTDNMCIVTWGAFQIYNGGHPPSGCSPSNCHIGRLLGQVLVTEGPGVDWTPGVTGPMVVRLLQ